MRKTWTITVDIQETDHVSDKDAIDEMEYWEGQVESALQSVHHTYKEDVEVANDRVNYQPIHFVNISVERS